MKCLSVWLLVLGSACAGPRYFTPRENVNGTGPGGQPAAVYPFASADSKGEVRLWSNGAHRIEVDGQSQLELRIGFEIENTGSQAVTLDSSSLLCQDLWIADQRLDALPPPRIEGSVEARPGTTAHLDVRFRPASAGAPREVGGFAVRFQLLAEGQPVLAQVTPFEPHVPTGRWSDERWRWGGGFFGPGYYGPGWGPGFGYGWSGFYPCH